MKLKFIHILEIVRSWLHSLDWLIREAIIYWSHRALALAVAAICTCTCQFLPVTVFALLVYFINQKDYLLSRRRIDSLIAYRQHRVIHVELLPNEFAHPDLKN